ncbi:MAG: HAMP domain-containing sensor histidine kinase [Candidatus Obscuribacterales bacterium]
MKHDLRRQLTIEFVLLFVLLYFLGGAVAIFMFAAQLDRSIDNQLQGLAAEVLPAVDMTAGGPSLKRWGLRAQSRREEVPFSIQVFDTNRHLLEEFGPIGHRQLSSGFVRVDGQNTSSLDDVNLRSFFIEIPDGTKLSGYLQVQVSARQRDDALKQIVLTMISLSPFLALAVAVCGSWFAGNAVKPVEETMELLRQFVADAAHEINTPISVIEASVQTLEATFEDSQLGSNVLAIINRASGRMKSLGQSLVVLSRMESPDYPAPIDHIRLDSIASPVLAECEQLARARRIKLCCELLPDVTLLGNSESLERLLLNLVANAIRYTDEDGVVNVKYKIDGDWLRISIEDNGIGIPDESMPHIFQRFYRVDKSRSRDIGGFGLGLAIVKAIIDRHKGEIQVESEVGKGSRFTVSLKRLP